jgi:hypothetical protein
MQEPVVYEDELHIVRLLGRFICSDCCPDMGSAKRRAGEYEPDC